MEYDLEDGKYEKVIDVLENLAEYMNLESTYPSVRFDDISSRLMDVPDKESIACVCNEVNSLLPQHQSWLLHDALRHGCDPEWIIVFLKDSKLKQLFSIDNDIPSDDSDDKEPWNIKNIRFLLDGYRNRKSSILLPYIEEIVIGLVKRMETDKKLFKNKGIVLCIISNSFISEKVISEPSMLAFWKKLARLKRSNYYHHFFSVVNDILLECSEEVRESYFDFMLDVVLKKSSCLNVINGKDINDILHFFGEDKPLERFKKIKRKTIKRDKEKAGPFSGWRGSPDCFENIRMKRCGSNEEYYANEYSAIRIMIHEMTQIDEGKTIAVYNDLRKRSSLLDINLSIYFCNLRFDVLKDVFFNNIFDYCDYKNRLEVYSLLHSHKDEIGAEYIDKIYRYILRIIEETDTRFIFDCKLIISFCELFENRCPELKMQKEKIMASISEKGKKAMKKITDVLDCTGDKGMAILEDCDEEEAETKITDLKTWCGLLRFVKTNNYDDFSSDIEKWMVTHFDLCELETFLFDSAFSLETYPVGFINDCFKLYMSRNEVQEKKLVMYFDKIKVDSRNLELVQTFSNYLVRNLSWMCSVSAQFKNFWRDLFDYSIRHRQSFFFDDSWFKSSSVYASHGFNLLSFLIWMADKVDWDKLKVVFHETITKGNDDSVVIRAAYAFTMARIYTLDQEYLYSVLLNVFYGAHEDVIIDVFVRYNKKPIYDSRFYEELQSNRILSFIVSLQDLNERAHKDIISYLSFLVALFIKGKISENVLDEVLSDFKELNIVHGGIMKLKEQANELNEDEVKRIKTVLTKIKEAKDVCFDALVILLLEMMRSSSLLKKYIWEDVLELAKRGFRDTYLGEVKKYFCEESFLTNEEKIILLESVLKKGEINELYNKEMIQIFDSIDWSNDKDRFHELIVIIQRQNMELSGQLITQFHLKYEKSDDCAVKDENA